MVRPYAVKGRKRRKKEEKYDTAEVDESSEEETPNKVEDEEEPPTQHEEKEETAPETSLSTQPSRTMSSTGAIFILEKASLEIAKVGKEYQLLNSDDHSHFLRRNNRNPAEYRPDIAHQAMLAILDSPLNKAGRMKALYVKTEKGILLEIKPHVRIPRTFKRFAGVMLQLLQKLSITAVGKREKLMRVIKNPVTQYLPPNSRKIGFSKSSEKLVDIQDYVASISDEVNFVFVVGAMSHGKIDDNYVDDYISISEHPLSAAGCIGRICYGLERKWKIL